MKNLKEKSLLEFAGGVCIKPSDAKGDICLPCAAIIAMGVGLGPGGAKNLICPL